MKKLLLFILLIPFISFAQNYSEVIKVPGKNKNQLYVSGREWFAESFKSANNVLQMDDPISGKLIGKGSLIIVLPYNSALMTLPIKLSLEFTIKVSVKDSTYKYEIGSIFIDSGGPHSIDEYKNASTIEGARQVMKDAGMNNPSDKLLKKTAAFNAAIYEGSNLEFQKTIESLKIKMKSTDNW
ncbi:MAG TPA: hypothetical protein DCR40_10295 [Prolixibacteraceae bacterium]|nr:hypothetical protein [Prolixibacteraceae bacterium]